MEGLAEYHHPVLVEGILITCWFRVLQGFHGGRLEWGVENVGRVTAYIYIFLLHVFNEAFQLKAFLEDIMRLVFPWLVEIRSQFHLPEERHVALQLMAFLVFL